ncbi:MAG: hypothetical protein WBV31_05175 [Terriglobales bacterium]
MKLKSLAVITLLVLGCSAAFGQSYSFGFLSYDGSTQYCDYESLLVSAPYAAGAHVLKSCGLPLDAVMVGLKTSIPYSTQQPVVGTVYALADSTFDAQYIGVSGEQIDWVTKLKAASGNHPKWGWSFYFTFGGGSDYLGNYGYLTTTLGDKVHGGTTTSFGAAHNQAVINKK